jgi:hypothetical protein
MDRVRRELEKRGRLLERQHLVGAHVGRFRNRHSPDGNWTNTDGQ